MFEDYSVSNIEVHYELLPLIKSSLVEVDPAFSSDHWEHKAAVLILLYN
jgi:hypothetical protein